MIDRKKTWQYKRILEVLNEYWINEPDEKKVIVDMSFEKENGETQHKHIVWTKELPKRKINFDYACPASTLIENFSISKQNRNEWISVNDRLPKNGDWVLVYGDGKIYMAFVDQDNQWCVDADGYDGHIENVDWVTHWMELPKGPYEDED